MGRLTSKQVALAAAILTIWACGGSDDSNNPGTLSIHMPIHYNDSTAKSVKIQNPYGTVMTIDPIAGASDNLTMVFNRDSANKPPADSAIDKATYKVFTSTGTFIRTQTLTFTYGEAKTAGNYDINWDGTTLSANPE